MPSNINFSNIAPCTQLDKYTSLKFIGCGSFGKVYRGIDQSNNNTPVAIKCVPLTCKDGIPIAIIRELNHLKSLKHENIVGLRDIFLSDDMNMIFIVLDYYPHDLSGIINFREIVFNESFTKSLMKQLLEGVAHLHEQGSIHCDLKTSNLFLDNGGELRIGDFNLSRFKQDSSSHCHNKFSSRNVVTLWYRAPELLLADGDFLEYGSEIDIWACGCILAELLLREPLFPGNDEVSQLNSIFSLFGTQNIGEWPHNFQKFRTQFAGRCIPDRFKMKFLDFYNYRPQVVGLLRKMLAIDPKQRITAREALQHEWFAKDPCPDPNSVLLPSSEVSINENWVREQIKLRNQAMKSYEKSNQDLKRKRCQNISHCEFTNTTTTAEKVKRFKHQ